jgi:hypothetical protein
MKDPCGFFNLYCHNFVRVALAVPTVLVADPAFNATRAVEHSDRSDCWVTPPPAPIGTPEPNPAKFLCEIENRFTSSHDRNRASVMKITATAVSSRTVLPMQNA